MMKNKKKYFFIILLKNPDIKKILDALRFISDPSQKNVSHITVKGPYKKRQIKILDKDNAIIAGKSIVIEGVGNFFTENQNTVYIKCSNSNELDTIWKSKKEKSYKEFNPHITIYDGSDRIFAQALFEKLNSEPLNIKLDIDKLDLYESKDKENIFNLNQTFDYDFISRLIGFDNLNEKEIKSLTLERRLYYLKKIYLHLESVSHQPKSY